MNDRYDVVGIGNALVDVLARVEDEFLAENGIEKGIMTLIDTARATELYGRMGPAIEISGGSGANTIAGLAMLGSRAAYVGKVKDDQLGAIFAHDIRALGATFETPMATGDHDFDTGRCMVLVSPDGERSMNTYLGVSEHLSPSDIDESMMERADWLYLEGYRFDGPDSVGAFARAVAACKRGGGRASVTLSDPFCVDRHRDAFRRMIRDDLDLLFANEHEVMSLYQTSSLEAALDACAKDVRLAAVTVGPKGAWVIEDGKRALVPTPPVQVVDATGAGDLFAAGFLHGLARGRAPKICARMGCVAAAEIISHIGARPEVDLKALMAKNGM
ncbi:MAG TPA: adenosine kinase [Thermohalobaculum sp.]|nr:adenosine kinase [Thermohalobaculum sp.]